MKKIYSIDATNTYTIYTRAYTTIEAAKREYVKSAKERYEKLPKFSPEEEVQLSAGIADDGRKVYAILPKFSDSLEEEVHKFNEISENTKIEYRRTAYAIKTDYISDEILSRPHYENNPPYDY